MAIELLNEHEQSELVRNWIRQNAGSILVGILIGLGLIVGWQQWQRMQRSQQQQAQLDYRALVEAADAGKPEDAAKLAATLRSDHAKSAYASLSSLRDAADAMKRGDLDAAAAALEWSHANSSFPALKELAALRLGQVRLAQGKADEALRLAGEAGVGGFKGLAAELRGDALLALDRGVDARAAYEEALASLDAGAPQRAYIEMKRDEAPLAVVPATPATPAAPLEQPVEKKDS